MNTGLSQKKNGLQNQSIDKTVPPIEPLNDTWGGKKSAGKWFIVPPFDFTNLSIQLVNAWYIDSTIGTINAFDELARVWKVFFSPSSESDIKGVVLEWQPGSSYTESTIDSVQTPEFRVTGADGVTRLAEVKTIVKPLEEESISRNLRKAISQIKGNIQAGEGGAYIRIDNTTAPPTTLTRNEIIQSVEKRLLSYDNKGTRGIDAVDFVEVLYQDAMNQTQQILVRVENGSMIVSP